MPPLRTGAEDPPLYTDRKPTPYAYTKPQKESLAPNYTLSPEPLTSGASGVPRSMPQDKPWRDERNQNMRPPKSSPIHSRYDSVAQPPRSPKPQDVFEDSDTEDASFLRADLQERKPARYSFVKSDLSRDDLRTSLLDQQAKAETRAAERPSRSDKYGSRPSSSSGSSKVPTPNTQSPRSSSSSLNHDSSTRRRERPAPVDTGDRRSAYDSSARPSRPHSPAQNNPSLHHVHGPSPPRSPRPRQTAGYPPSPGPSSRIGTPVNQRPSSPLTGTSQSAHPRIAVTEADWRSTYPPVTSAPKDRSRPPSRVGRHDTMPTPRIDIKSPSPARPPKTDNSLPYPVNTRSGDYFMPPEEIYQYDHSSANTPTSPNPMGLRERERAPYTDSPKGPSSPAPGSGSSRDGDRHRLSSTYTISGSGPSIATKYTTDPSELEPPRTYSSRARSRSKRPDHRRTVSVDRPLPSCPRSSPSSEQDWYLLDGCPNFDICPSCYTSVFASTPFANFFQPVRRYDTRFCDFSTAWMRLAWLMTIKQRRSQLDLLYQLATVAEYMPPCPGDRERGISAGMWYGIPDPRDGVHIANFAVCTADVKMLEILCPSLRNYFTPIPALDPYSAHLPSQKLVCAFRVSSKRFPKYLDLLVEIDAEAQATGQVPDIARFMKMAREYAFKPECQRDKPLPGRAWHYIPSVPEFTVCEECFDDVILPYYLDRNRIARLFSGRTMLIPSEHEEADGGSSCCLYSSRMRRVWERAAQEEDFGYLRRKAVERKRVGERLGREKRVLEGWRESLTGVGMERERERLERDIGALDEEWAEVE